MRTRPADQEHPGRFRQRCSPSQCAKSRTIVSWSHESGCRTLASPGSADDVGFAAVGECGGVGGTGERSRDGVALDLNAAVGVRTYPAVGGHRHRTDDMVTTELDAA